MLMLAGHEEKQWIWKGKKFCTHPGQFITSLDSLAKKAGVSVRSVRTALANFEKLDFLTSQSTKTGRLITVVNWALYQSRDEETTNEATNDRQSTDKAPTTTKNNKNNKKYKERVETADAVTSLVNEYHSRCSLLPKVIKVTDKRQRAVKARLSDDGLDTLLQVFDRANQSAFLTGNNDRGWKADFDWLINQTNMAKVLEGKYDNKQAGRDQQGDDLKWFS